MNHLADFIDLRFEETVTRLSLGEVGGSYGNLAAWWCVDIDSLGVAGWHVVVVLFFLVLIVIQKNQVSKMFHCGIVVSLSCLLGKILAGSRAIVCSSKALHWNH